MSAYGIEGLKWIKGPREQLPFSMDEYERRLKQVRRVMEERGIDVLLVNDSSNICYLTGHAYPSYLFAQAIVPRGPEKGVTIVCSEVDLGVVTDSTWVRDIRTWPQEKDVFPGDYVKVILKEKSLDDKTIGYQLASGQLPPSTYLKFREILPEAKFVEASDIVTSIQYVKSPKEIEYCREAAKLAEIGAEAGIDAIREGVTEREIAFAISKALYEHGSEYRSGFCLASGPNTASLHHSPTTRKIRKGDLVTMEPIGNCLYYHCTILRTAALGSPSKKAKDLHRVAMEALIEGTKMIRPGVTMESVEEVTREVAAKYGYEKYRCHRVGFSMGRMGMIASDLEHSMYGLMKGEKSLIKPGMIFTIEPNFADLEERIGILLGNNVLVTETGCEPLYELPLDLVEK